MSKLSFPIALAYHQATEDAAHKLANDLQAHADLKMFPVAAEALPVLYQELNEFAGPIVLLLSDNFLRAIPSMYKGLDFLTARQEDVFAAVTAGVQKQEDGTVVHITTQLSRVTDIIQYINYWQDRYLDLRKQRSSDPSLNEDGFNEHLRQVREVSGQAGEFIRILRNLPGAELTDLRNSNYAALAEFLEEPDLPSWVQGNSVLTSEETSSIAEELADESVVEKDTISTIPSEETEEVKTQKEAVEESVSEEEPTVNLASIPGMDMLGIDAGTTTAEESESEEVEWETPPTAVPTEQVAEEVEVVIEKAWTILDEGDQDAALLTLEGIAKQQNDNEKLWYNYALMLAQAGKTAKATEAVERVLKLSDSNIDALFLAGELADVQQNGQQARTYYEQILVENDELAEVWYQLGSVLQSYFPDEQVQAIEALKKAMKLDKAYAHAAYQIAQIYLTTANDEEKAEKYLLKTVKSTPDNAFAKFDLATLYHKQNKTTEAYTAYQSAVELHPELKTAINDEIFALPQVSIDQQEAIDALQARIQELEEQLSEQKNTVETEPEEPVAPARPGKGQLVMITGATAGIGLATARKFAALGFDLIITGRRAERLNELAAELSNDHQVEVHTSIFDVRHKEEVEGALAKLPGDWKAIDVLINNAGKAKGLDPIQSGNTDHWDEMIDTNLRGLLYVTRAVVPGMIARGRGHVINLCSTAGKEVYPKGNVYCATKHAVDALTQGMRIDLHQHGIRVSQVSPAHVEETEFALVRFDGDTKKAKIYEDFQPLTARDVAETLGFLATQPAHVNILDVLLQGTQQASSTIIDRSGR